MPATHVKTTIHDIAGALGVSASTVSRALSGNAVISAETRARVLAKATELGYTPNRVASALRSGRSRLIGVVIPRANRAFFADIIDGVEAAAAARDYRVLVMQHHDDSARELALTEALRDLRVDGIVVCVANDGQTDRAAYHRYQDEGLPVHFVDRRVVGLRGPAVVLDDFGGGYAATEHLIAQGFRRIGHLRRPQAALLYTERTRGYRAALASAGLAYDEALDLVAASEVAAGHEAFAALWALPPERRPDAVFSSSDFAALGLLQAAAAAGVRVPDELAVVGFANEPFTAYVTPALTSVEQSPGQMGRLAAERLLDRIGASAPAAGHDGTLVLEPRLVVRASSRRGGAPVVPAATDGPAAVDAPARHEPFTTIV